MKRYVLLAVLLVCSGARAEGVDLGVQARQIVSVRCAQCHGPQLAKPKGKFGYVTDLRRVAANPKLVVPFDASASKLWQDIDNHDMPPDGAAAGPLSEPEKSIIRGWIEAGAPRRLHPDTQPADFGVTNGTTREPTAMSRSLRLLGKLHVPLIHFPIALLIAAAAGDLWFAWRRRAGIHHAVRFCIALGAVAAVFAAALGWLHATYAGYGPQNRGLFLHRWAGIAAAGLAVLTLIAAESDSRRNRRSRIFIFLLLLTCAVIGLTGHLGGSLVFGDDYFRF